MTCCAGISAVQKKNYICLNILIRCPVISAKEIPYYCHFCIYVYYIVVRYGDIPARGRGRVGGAGSQSATTAGSDSSRGGRGPLHQPLPHQQRPGMTQIHPVWCGD